VKDRARAKKKPEVVPGVVEAMPGLPGPAEQLPIDTEAPIIGPIGPGESASGVATGNGDVDPLEPVITAGYNGQPLEEATELAAEARASIATLPEDERAKLAEFGAVLAERKLIILADDGTELEIRRPITPEPAAETQKPTYNVWRKRKYRVWPHGELHRDGVVYKPGDELTLTEDVAQAIGCLELVE
jgi:hypothetical protein